MIRCTCDVLLLLHEQIEYIKEFFATGKVTKLEEAKIADKE